MLKIQYIGPSQVLRAAIAKTMNLGLDIDPKTGAPNAQRGLATRAKALRDLIGTWGAKVHPNYLKKINDVLTWASQPGDLEEKPVMPDPSGYDMAALEQRTTFIQDCEKAFERLDRWHLEDRQVKILPEREPSNRFMKMTDGISLLVGELEETGRTIDRGKNVYRFLAEYNNVVTVKEKKDVDFFLGLVAQTKNAPVDTAKYVLVTDDSVEEPAKTARPKKQTETDETRTVPEKEVPSKDNGGPEEPGGQAGPGRPGRHAGLPQQDPPQEDTPQLPQQDTLQRSPQQDTPKRETTEEEEMREILSDSTKQELMDNYPKLGLKSTMSKVEMIDKIIESEAQG